MPFQTFDFERADLRARLAALCLDVKLLRLAHARRRARWDVKDSDNDTEGPDDDDGPYHHDGPTQLAQNFPPRDHNGPPGGPLPEEILPMLLPLLSHKTAWVRYVAAINTLVVAPIEARNVINDLAVKSNNEFATAYARATVNALERGTFPLK